MSGNNQKDINNKQKIEINDAGTVIEFDRMCMKNCTETSEGISIQLLNGMSLLYENINMPSTTKKTIIYSILNYTKVKKIIINLRDYKTPIKLIAQ